MSNSNGLKVQINYSEEDGLTELIISCDWLPTLGVKPLINISDKLFNKTIDDFVENLVKLIEGNSKIPESTSAKQKNVSEEIRNTSNAENKKNNTIMYVVVLGAILAVLYMAFVGFQIVYREKAPTELGADKAHIVHYRKYNYDYQRK